MVRLHCNQHLTTWGAIMKHDYCVACTNKENLHQHHLIPSSQGGSNDETNLITLCGECHAKVHGNRSKWNTSELTKAALAAKKARGEPLGNFTSLATAQVNSAIIRGGLADDFAMKYGQHITEMINEGKSMNAIAQRMNGLNVKTVKGGRWTCETVKRVVARLG